MKNKMLAKLILTVFLLMVSSSVVEADLQYDWKVDDFHLSDYQDLYLYGLNLKDLTVATYDEEDDDYAVTGLGDKVTDKIVNSFQLSFEYFFNGVIPLNDARKIDPSKKSLVAEMDLSGKFVREDIGLFTALVRAANNQVESVRFSCILKDSQTGETLLEITDEKELVMDTASQPFSYEREYETLNKLIEFWAKTFANILSEKK